ncbi:MAG: chaperone NapD [Alphaproteobacteria bacterium]|nr:chaperone NapD [Alphaproteobacteria bacterium]
MNICGVLVHALPKRGEDVAAAIAGLDGAELHQTIPDGRMIVTVEDTEENSAGDTVLALHRIPGVLSAALVYHNFETDEAIEPNSSNSGE